MRADSRFLATMTAQQFTAFALLCSVGGASAVPSIALNNGVSMPVLALGTGGYDNATAAQAVRTALGAGLRHVHAAFDYFNLPGVGDGLRGVDRSSIFVTAMTSPCVHPAAPPQRNVTDPKACEELTAREIGSTLRQLGLSQVDLLLLHGLFHLASRAGSPWTSFGN